MIAQKFLCLVLVLGSGDTCLGYWLQNRMPLDLHIKLPGFIHKDFCDLNDNKNCNISIKENAFFIIVVKPGKFCCVPSSKEFSLILKEDSIDLDQEFIVPYIFLKPENYLLELNYSQDLYRLSVFFSVDFDKKLEQFALCIYFVDSWLKAPLFLPEKIIISQIVAKKLLKLLK